MIQFQYPELFLLALPLWFAYRRWGRTSGVTGWLRLAMLAVLLVALTGPEWNLGGRGIDVIVVADRSRSMPAGSQTNIRELIQNLERNRGTGDRVGVVTFGSQAEVESILTNSGSLGEYTQEVQPDGSDLNAALATALNLVDKNRPARILVFSDGEANGPSPLSSARRAREENVPIDYRLFERQRVGDAAVESILLPETVSPREPFQFSVWIYSDRETQGTVRVLRDGQPITQREQNLATGMNRMLFRDLLEDGGLYNYRVDLEVEGDPIRENNRGAGVVRVDSGPRLLVLNNDGEEGNLVGQLRAARIPVDVARAAEHPVSLDALDPYRAVVLENVPARDLGGTKMETLAQFVEDLGGGLMLTGGERSFGTGGYFLSPLDDVLPVSMELREEHRKNSLALAISLDRSGSMRMPAGGGKSKMDLANLGTAECVRLLTPNDSVVIFAVDTAVHTIQPLTRVTDPEAIAQRALRIESMGGGIYVYDALVAAGRELMKAEQSTKHIILFSDAADSERPGDYKNLLKKFEEASITVSVIGLGTERDIDADLLKDIAKRGNGNIMFTENATELPRLFTEDTMSMARSSFITKDPETQPNGIPGQLLPDARLLGELGSGAFPSVDGYNLSYLKPNATAGVISLDEYQAPWAAFWYRGLGRTIALTLEVDGQYSGQFGRWESYNDFLITHARWLLGGNNPNEVFITAQQEGQEAVVTVELDPNRSTRRRFETPKLAVIPPGSDRDSVLEPVFTWTGPHSLEARFRMDRTGTYRTLVQTDEREFTRGPAITLPYSPEYVPRIGLPSGAETLRSIAEVTGGKARTDVLEVLANPPRSARTASLLPWLFALSLVLLVVEIAGRRLSLWERAVQPATVEEQTTAPLPSPRSQPAAGWFTQWKQRLSRRPSRSPASAPSSVEPSAQPSPKPAASAPASTGTRSVSSIYEQAKRRAKHRLND